MNQNKNTIKTIPDYQKNLLGKGNSVNFSLYFPRMVSWELEHGDGKLQKYTGEEIKHDKYGNIVTNKKTGKPKWEKQNDDYIEELSKAGNRLLKQASLLLSNIHKHQKDYIDFLKSEGIATIKIEAKTISPFITGLGSGHPTETGMILDRNTGVPYIPASSVKGVFRLACAINIAKKKGISEVNLNDEVLVKYFGAESDSNPKRGQLVILDVYPKTISGLQVDIMNPHFQKYYDGTNKQPVETESPIPIKFLTVPKGTEFVFNLAYIPLKKEDKCDEAELKKIINTAFENVGFGGKTSIGYGRFKEI